MRAPAPRTQNHLSQMTEAEWNDLYKRIRLYSYKTYGWLQTKVSGLDLETVMQESIEDVYFGVRHWPVVDEHGTEKNISLCAFLCQTIRSKVSHILEEGKRKVSLDGNPDDGRLEFTSIAYLLKVRTAQDCEHQAIYNQLASKLLQAVRQDTRLTEITKLLIEIPDLQPRDIAQRMGLSIEEVRNALRRLGRKAWKVREEWVNG